MRQVFLLICTVLVTELLAASRHLVTDMQLNSQVTRQNRIDFINDAISKDKSRFYTSS